MTTLEIRVHDARNEELLGWIRDAMSASFSDEFNGAGSGDVEVVLSSADADLLRRDNVVRIYYRGRCVFAWVVESLERSLAGRDEVDTLRASGRGLMSWLDDAVIYPQGGFAAYASPDRPFNFASADGSWLKNAEYQAAKAVKWRDDKTARKGQPRKWPDPDASWIWITDPTAAVEAGVTGWFRSSFTLEKATRVKFAVTADNRFEVFLDGAPLLTTPSGYADRTTWSTMSKKTVKVDEGPHTLAARVQNEKPFRALGVSIQKGETKDEEKEGNAEVQLEGFSDGLEIKISKVDDDRKHNSGLSAGTYWTVNSKPDFFLISKSKGGSPVKIKESTSADVALVEQNTAGFLLTASAIGSDNRPGQVVARTSSGWLAAAKEPKWVPALIVWTLVLEAKARGVTRIDKVTRSFTDLKDSAGVDWVTERDTTIPVGTGLLDVMDYTVDLGIDWWINPVTCEVSAWERRGRDLSDTVRLNLGRELLSYATVEERELRTAAIVRTKDGWTEARENVRTHGRRETIVQTDRTRSESTGEEIAKGVLARLGRTRVVADRLDAVATDNATPYRQFTVGDIVGVPSPGGRGAGRARVLSISMQTSGEDESYSLELEVLGG